MLRLVRICSAALIKLLPFDNLRYEGIWKLLILGLIEANFSSLKIDDVLLVWKLGLAFPNGLQWVEANLSSSSSYDIFRTLGLNPFWVLDCWLIWLFMFLETLEFLSSSSHSSSIYDTSSLLNAWDPFLLNEYPVLGTDSFFTSIESLTEFLLSLTELSFYGDFIYSFSYSAKINS